MKHSHEHLDARFWLALLGSAFWFVLAYVGYVMDQGGKIAIAILFGGLFLHLAVKRLRDFRFARRLKNNPELMRIYNARNQ